MKRLLYYIHRCLVWVNPRIEMARCYYKVFNSWPDFVHPKTLVEKIYWLQLNVDTIQWSVCADKYLVREYVRSKGLGNTLNSIYAVWDKPEDVDFTFLPQNFIIKMNNACNHNIVVNDKDHINIEEIRSRLKWWYRHPFGASGGELHYLRIEPRIIAEKLIPVPKGEVSLMDYKIWCFGGKPFCILVVFGRTVNTVHLALYDLKWNSMSYYLKNAKHVIVHEDVVIPRPDCLDEMLRIAEVLSSDFPEVRVDLYNVDNQPVFGEMTFSTGFGYFTDEFYRILGDKVVLPLDNKE